MIYRCAGRTRGDGWEGVGNWPARFLNGGALARSSFLPRAWDERGRRGVVNIVPFTKSLYFYERLRF